MFWVDIEPGLLHELNWATGEVQIWNINRRVSLIFEADDEQLILAVQGGIVSFDLQTNKIEWLADIEKSNTDRRCNDGGVDAKGRFWIGVMDIHCKTGEGSLYRLDNLTDPPVKMLGGLTIPNGLVWSQDGKRLYFIDTVAGAVKSYIYHPDSGDIRYEGEVIRIPSSMGMPDGMTIDKDGMLWIALYGGSAISRWNPVDGALLELIKMPVPNITNCCFAGEQLDELVITSARENLNPKQLARYPESGNVFVVKHPGTIGVRPSRSD